MIEGMPKPDYEREGSALYGRDCRDVMREMPDSSIGLIATDPPYHSTKKADWDKQWKTDADFLAWVGDLCEDWHRVLQPNGSLYCFASTQMADRVSVAIRERLNVLNRITWVKPDPSCDVNRGAGLSGQCSKESLRSYFPRTEEVIFAEHYNADNIAKGETRYVAKCDELRGFVFEPLRAYIASEFERAGMLTQEGKIAANVACGFSPSAGGNASRHYFSRSQWRLPTREHYHTMRDLLRRSNCRTDYLSREYEDLRREYEDLRTEYESLRRPFSVTADVPYTDVWTFPTVQAYPGKHPCEKPLEMMEHIVRASSREDFVVFDGFAGRGTTLVAAAKLGRRAIGVELEPKYFDIACRRVDEAFDNAALFEGVAS